MKTYELHTLKGGKWKIDSIFDDSETALQEARRAQTANRYTTIRVVEENHDPLSNKSTARTIFHADGGNHPDPRAHPPRVSRPAKTAGGAPGKAPAGTEPMEWKAAARAPQPRKKPASIVWPLLLLLFIGIAVMAGLRFSPSGT
ncbi:MAG: hypothetical protein WD470_05450 [Rhodospirillaceae bacterium]